jgi:4-amino-4-deoxy-L-arabinose transferase-like glycosyltransferase
VQLGQLLGYNSLQTVQSAAQLSLILSLLTFVVGLYTARSFFKENRVKAALACALLATAPSLVLLAPQINNDTLLTFFGFLWFGALLAASHSHNPRTWAWVGVLIGMGMLTKGNANLWIPVSALCAWIAAKNVRGRVQSITATALPALLIASPLFLWRYLFDPRYQTVANALQQKNPVFLTTSLNDLLGFNPIHIIQHPILDTGITRPPAPSFLESLFITGHLGVDSYGPESAILLTMGLLLLPVFLAGCIRTLSLGKYVIPIAILGLVGELFLFRLSLPFESSQHFRYIITFMLPFSFLIAEGTQVRSTWVRPVLESFVGAYAVVSAAFIVAIFLAT